MKLSDELCGYPPKIDYGTYYVSGTELSVVYGCDKDFALIGNDMIECQSSGNWTEPSKCVFGKARY